MHFFPFSSSSHKDGGSRVPVYLNVYDLTTVNNYLYWFGLGIFHSGIEEPRSCPGFIFRRAVLLGKTSLSRSEVQEMMEHLSRDFHGDCYHLITKNCNHFTDEACLKLTGKAVPGWVNRLARLGSFCNCLLPESIKVAPVQHLPGSAAYNDDDDEAASFISSASLASDEEENSNHHLLTVPNVEVSIVKEKPIRLAKELL
ncbi:DeSI-like protein At4g17486 [Linum perenne]